MSLGTLPALSWDVCARKDGKLMTAMRQCRMQLLEGINPCCVPPPSYGGKEELIEMEEKV